MRAFRTQGRLLHWSPADPDVEQSKKAVPASHPNISARFVKETALHKRGTFLSRRRLFLARTCYLRRRKQNKRGTFLPDIDMIDCAVRQENIHARGDPIMLQLPLVPAYALTVHKTQAVASGRPFGLYLHCLFVAMRTHSNVTRTSLCCFTRHALSIKHQVLGCRPPRTERDQESKFG